VESRSPSKTLGDLFAMIFSFVNNRKNPKYDQASLMGCLVPTQKLYTSSHRMSGDIHGALNIDKK
jgi:hypothetical protein